MKKDIKSKEKKEQLKKHVIPNELEKLFNKAGLTFLNNHNINNEGSE